MIALTGCQTGQPTHRPQSTSIKCSVPSVNALPETKEAQEKGGVEIAVVPALYKAVRLDQVIITPEQPTMREQLSLIGQNAANKVFVAKTTIPRLGVQPERLQFNLRINNKLARVFRGQGAVVQFNVGGKLVPFGNTDYKEFINGIVPPRNETELKIYGPSLSLIPEKGTIGIFLYDVVTATDPAGNVTEKQNYEWYFNYSTQIAEETAESKTTRGLMDITEYQQIKRREATEQVRAAHGQLLSQE